MEYEYRYTGAPDDHPIELRAAEDGVGPGTIRSYAAVFDRLSMNLGGFVEKVAPRAFDRIVKTATTVALFNHDKMAQLGSRGAGTLRLLVDDTGLAYEIDLPDTGYGRDVAALVERGDLRGSSFSFGLATRKDGRRAETWTRSDQGYPVRTLDEIAQLRDVGPVTFPAYPSTAELGIAMRCLALDLERPVDDVVELAARNELRDLFAEPETPPPGDAGTSAPPTGQDVDAWVIRRAAEHRWRRLPPLILQR